jgi:hypothetical protein
MFYQRTEEMEQELLLIQQELRLHKMSEKERRNIQGQAFMSNQQNLEYMEILNTIKHLEASSQRLIEIKNDPYIINNFYYSHYFNYLLSFLIKSYFYNS